MTKLNIKISAKNGSSSRKSKLWNISLPANFVEDELGYVPRVKLTVENGNLIVCMNTDQGFGVLVSRPNPKVAWYYSSIGQGHLSNIAVPFDTAAITEVKATFNSRTRRLTIKAADLPDFVQLAIRNYADLAQEVASHQPEHSAEEFRQLVEDHKGGHAIGDQEAVEALFMSDNNFTDREARTLVENLNRLLQSRTDVRVKLVNGEVKLSKVVEQEIEL